MSGQDVRLKAFQLTAFLIDAEPSDFFFKLFLVVSANPIIYCNRGEVLKIVALSITSE